MMPGKPLYASHGFSVLAAADEQPWAPFIISHEKTWSFAEAAAQVERHAAWLLDQGVQPQQDTPIAFSADVDPASLFFLLALLELRIPAFPLHAHWTEAEVDGALAKGQGTRREARRISPPRLDAVLARPRTSPDFQPQTTDDERVLAVIHTSGSSGEPRGILLSHRAFAASANAHAANLDWQVNDRWLLTLPLAHIGGLSIVTRCLSARKPLVLANGAAPKLSLRQVLDCAAQHEVTLMSWVPTQLYRALQQDLRCPASVRAILLGGAAAPEELIRQGREAGWPVLATYGSTETCSQIVTQQPGEASTRGVGRALRGVELDIRDQRIWVRAPSLFSGYYPEQPPAFDPEGWFATQDIGAIDEHGTLYVMGRADQVIISGGENVFPDEVEAALSAHPNVEGASVFAVEDAELGQRVAALVVTRDQLPADLPEFLRARLARHKLPRLVVVAETLPLNASGKVDRARVRELAAGRLIALRY